MIACVADSTAEDSLQEYLLTDSSPCETSYTDYEPPKELRISEWMGIDSLKLTWKTSTRLHSNHTYRIHCWSCDKDRLTYNSCMTEQLITNLKLATRYFAHCTVMNGDSRVSTPSNLVKICTEYFMLELTQASEVYNSMIKLQWSLKWKDKELVLDGQKKYRVYYWCNETEKSYIEIHRKEYTIKGLKPDSIYSAYVIVVDGENTFPQASNTIEFETEPRMPKAIKTLRYEGSPHDHLLVQFDGKQGDNVKHEIILTPVHQDVEDRKSIITKKTKVLVNNLDPGTMYDITVQTIQESLRSQPASCDEIARLCPADPKLDEPVFQNNILKVSWEPLDVAPTKYVVRWTVNGKGYKQLMEETYFNVPNLQSCAVYKFQVAAVNDAGRGPFSQVETHVTGPAQLKDAVVTKNPEAPETSFIVRFNDPDSTPKRYKAVAEQPNGEVCSCGTSKSHLIVLNGLRPGCPYKVSVIAIFCGLESVPVYCSNLRN